MTGAEFVEQLKTENEELLARIDAPAVDRIGSERVADTENRNILVALMKMALKNEMEAAEIAAEWVATTPELDAKVALARHAGDEARHYELVEERARGMDVALDGFNPLDPPSPVLRYLRTLGTTVERIAAALVAREAMGGRRNVQFLAYLETAGQRELATLYREIINPDEERHHRSGCALLARLANTPAKQEEARRAARGLLETGDRVRAAALEQTGAPVIPGC
jgi:hypothetical protein